MPLICKHTFRVRHYECDACGHLNNANHLRYVWVDLETRRPIRIPPDILADFAPNLYS